MQTKAQKYRVISRATLGAAQHPLTKTAKYTNKMENSSTVSGIASCRAVHHHKDYGPKS